MEVQLTVNKLNLYDLFKNLISLKKNPKTIDLCKTPIFRRNLKNNFKSQYIKTIAVRDVVFKQQKDFLHQYGTKMLEHFSTYKT